MKILLVADGNKHHAGDGASMSASAIK